MKKFLVLFLGISIFSFGCVKTKVLKVKRVDQKLYGNAGYLQGEIPQEIKNRKQKKYRNILEIDVSDITDSYK